VKTRYSSQPVYPANSDQHTSDQQNQQQNYNYYSQQGSTYYCPPSGQTPASGPDEQPVGDSRQSESHENEISSQHNPVVSNSIEAENSQIAAKIPPETKREVGQGVEVSSQDLKSQDQGSVSYGSHTQAQGENYQGYNLQSSGNVGQQSYNPETPTYDYSEWKQQSGTQEEQQQQQQWCQQGWTWNSYQGAWQHSSWPQQPQQQQGDSHGNDQQQQQWSGWGQWAGQGGGQWPVQQQQPGTEGWMGQSNQSHPGYDQSYSYQGI